MDGIYQLKSQRDQIGTWGRINKRRLKAILNYAGDTVLDAGCSNGKYVGMLRSKGYISYGIDLLDDPSWGELQQKSCFLLADVSRLPFRNKAFKTICAFEVLEHLTDVRKALREFHRVAEKNIILSVPNCTQPGIFQKSGVTFHHHIDKTHQQFFTKDELITMITQENFCVTHFEYINPIRPEALLLSAWRVPTKIASFIGQLANYLPLRQKYYMTMLVVANIRAT